MSDKPNTTTLPDGWRLFDKYQIRHTDGTPLKGKRYFVLRLDTDDPAEAARVAAAMSAYKGETQGNAAKLREAASDLASIFDCDIQFLERHAKELRDTGAYGGGIIEHILHSIRLAKEALATPARECDKYENHLEEDGLLAAFKKHCDECDCPMGCIHRRLPTRGDSRDLPILGCFARFALSKVSQESEVAK